MAGNESDGRSSSFNDGIISAPNSRMPTVKSATILLLARLNLDKNDMLYTPEYINASYGNIETGKPF
jgi:hypothetical protein